MTLSHRAARPTGVEWIRLDEAPGRVTAEAVVAACDYPDADRAAMDGFALHRFDLAATTFGLVCPIFPDARPPPLEPGTAAPISTGSVIPEGCAAVVAHEKIDRVVEGKLRLHKPPEDGRNIRRRGEDALSGETVLAAGRVVAVPALGALASFGGRANTGKANPRVTLLPTGSELVSGAFTDTNSPMIAATLSTAGATVERGPPTEDNVDCLCSRLLAALEQGADMLVTTGGVSVASRDLVSAALQSLGAKILVCGVNVRPAKPTVVARFADGRLAFGLLGNPLAALVAARFLTAQAIRGALRLPLEIGVPAAGGEPRQDTTLVLKAKRRMAEDGRVAVEVLPGQQSHRLRSLLDADCWLAVPHCLGAQSIMIWWTIGGGGNEFLAKHRG